MSLSPTPHPASAPSRPPPVPGSPPAAATLIESALSQPIQAIAYSAGRALRERWPDRAILECTHCGFDLDGFLDAGEATSWPDFEDGHIQVLTAWRGCPEALADPACTRGEEGLLLRPTNAWLRIEWKGLTLRALSLSWGEMVRFHRSWFLVGDDRRCLEEFYEAVCRWSAVPHGEVLVFEKGQWRKDRGLFESIRETRAEELILAPGLKDQLFGDLRAFFGSRDVYARLGVPWKRGILLHGPPGNGKTHAIRAICGALELPVLYVRSLEASGMFQPIGEHAQISEVFALARRTAPCLLILEDLDSLITPSNRSVLLNELDGLAQNTGLCVLATTNHPEKLDPAILERPSRFDRKYAFDLPGPDERRAYLEAWTHRQTAELRLPAAAIQAMADGTGGFSFAYLKELCLATTMAWVNATPGTSLDVLALEQTRTLQAQRLSPPPEPPAAPAAPSEAGLLRGLLGNF